MKRVSILSLVVCFAVICTWAPNGASTWAGKPPVTDEAGFYAQALSERAAIRPGIEITAEAAATDELQGEERACVEGQTCVSDSECAPEGMCIGTACVCKCVPPGQDCWPTPCDGTTHYDFSLSPLLAGTFPDVGGFPNDSYSGVVDLCGSGGGFTADTRINRLGPMCFPDPPPHTETIEIEIVALNLVSMAPITVTYGSGMFSQDWDVKIDLPMTPPQTRGDMTVTKTHPDGGIFSATLPVNAQVWFGPASGISPPPGPWIVGPIPAAKVVLQTIKKASWRQDCCDFLGCGGLGFFPGFGLDPNCPTCQCCQPTCHANPAGGHEHCTYPPDCNPCPTKGGGGNPSPVNVNTTTTWDNHGGWFEFIAATDSTSIETCGSSFDTVLEVFENDGATLLASNDDCACGGSWGAGSDPQASCYDCGGCTSDGEPCMSQFDCTGGDLCDNPAPVSEPDSCVCVATVPGTTYKIRVSHWTGTDPPIPSTIVLTLTKKASCCDKAVPAGDDCWQTACFGDAPTQYDFSQTPIQADFFGPYSLGFTDVVEFGGNSWPDTIITRKADMCLEGTHADFPVSATVPIEITKLDLIGCNTLTVNFDDGGGTPWTEDWNVQVVLDATQTQGTLDVTKLNKSGGTFDTWLPVAVRFDFIPKHVGATLTFPPAGDAPISMDLASTGMPWLQTGTHLVAGCGSDGFFPGFSKDDATCCDPVCHAGTPGHDHCVVPPECPPCPADDGWFWKDYNDDELGGYMPDYDQNKDYDGDTLINRERYYCGPTAVANSLWWFHHKFPAAGVVPAAWDKSDLVEDLAQRMGTKGFKGAADDPYPSPTDPANRTAYGGTYVDDMQAGIDDYLTANGLDTLLYEHTQLRPDFTYIADEVQRSQDVVLLLGFYHVEEVVRNADSTGWDIRWQRTGGHYVTVAGVNKTTMEIAISDPDADAAEFGAPGVAGVVRGGDHNHDGDGIPGIPTIPFFGAGYDHYKHNKKEAASHDKYALIPSFSPGGDWGLVGMGDPLAYGAALADGHICDAPLPASHAPFDDCSYDQYWSGVSDAFLAANGYTTPAPCNTYTEIEYAVVVSPITCDKPVPAGDDCWETPCGWTHFDFATTPIPAGSFGSDSKAYTGAVQLGGGITSPDTRILRKTDMCLDGTPPVTTSVEIQLIQLDLESCDPITVEYEDTAGVTWTEDWNVKVILDGKQPQGRLDVTKDNAGGGTFDTWLPVVVRFEFTPKAGGATLTFPPAADAAISVKLTSTGLPWSQTGPTGGTLCGNVGFFPGYQKDGDQCCPKSCHANPAGGHEHCVYPPECQPCPQAGACCFWSKYAGGASWACRVMLPAECTALQNSTFLGPKSACPSGGGQAVHNGVMVTHYTKAPEACTSGGRNLEPDCIDVAGCDPIDPWVTTGACVDFSVQPIQAGFFGPGGVPPTDSDPFTDVVCLENDPLGPIDIPGCPAGLDFGQADTLIRRAGDPFTRFDQPGPSKVSVEAEIIALQLKGIAPITVTFHNETDCVANPANCQEWNLAVDLSEVTPPPGSVSASKTHCNGGTYGSVLNVQPRFTFTRKGTVIEKVLDTGLEGLAYDTLIQEQVPGSPWMDDLRGLFVSESPICSDFHPGFVDPAPVTDCLGACCDHDTGTCTDGVLQANCNCAQCDWFKNTLCKDPGVTCEQHQGACCDHLTGDCRYVTPDQCTGYKEEWFKDLDCADPTFSCTVDWFWKDYDPKDPDVGHMPDYDQNKDYDGDTLINRERYYCGPVAVANSLWWFHHKFPTDEVVPETWTKWDLVEDLAHRMGTKGFKGAQDDPYQSPSGRTGPYGGTYVDDMQLGIAQYLTEMGPIGPGGPDGLLGLLYEHTEPRPDFTYIATEVQRSQDVVLLLGFYKIVKVNPVAGTDAWTVRWQRTGGHYVTVAGVNKQTQGIAISDPDDDAAEAGAPGVVRPGGVDHNHDGDSDPSTTTGFRTAAYDHTKHNDKGMASHDMYTLGPSFSPGGDVALVTMGDPIAYGFVLAPYHECDAPLPEAPDCFYTGYETTVTKTDLAAWGYPPPIPDQVYTEIEYAVVVSPKCQKFGELVAPRCPPICSQPDLSDLLYVLDAFSAGPNWNADYPLADLGSGEPAPCDQDGRINLDDILHELSAIEGRRPCPDPCAGD